MGQKKCSSQLLWDIQSQSETSKVLMYGGNSKARCKTEAAFKDYVEIQETTSQESTHVGFQF